MLQDNTRIYYEQDLVNEAPHATLHDLTAYDLTQRPATKKHYTTYALAMEHIESLNVQGCVLKELELSVPLAHNIATDWMYHALKELDTAKSNVMQINAESLKEALEEQSVSVPDEMAVSGVSKFEVVLLTNLWSMLLLCYESQINPSSALINTIQQLRAQADAKVLADVQSTLITDGN